VKTLLLGGDLRSVEQRHPSYHCPSSFSTDRISKFTMRLTNSIGDQGATHLGSMLCINTSLTNLDLDAPSVQKSQKDKASAITCDGAGALADSLTVNSTLRVLSLNSLTIADKGATALAQV
jgi:hypothetical protein